MQEITAWLSKDLGVTTLVGIRLQKLASPIAVAFPGS